VASFPLAFPPTTNTSSSSPHSCYIPRPSHPPRLDYSNNTWQRAQIMKLFIMQFSPGLMSILIERCFWTRRRKLKEPWYKCFVNCTRRPEKWVLTSVDITCYKARVFRRDSPPTRSRSTGSGGESSSMLTSVEGNAVQGRMLLKLNLRRLLALKANEWLIITPFNCHECTWPTTAQLFLDCHF
jgi:hypothetical protein